jgi:uncharacterized protein YndB with AHSA1/START domain
MDGRCSIRLTRRFAEPPAEVWRALTDPQSLARWLRSGFEVPQAAVEPGRVLELDWRPPGEEPSIVRIELSEHGEGTVLVLDHERIQADRGMSGLRFWTAAVARLGVQGVA